MEHLGPYRMRWIHRYGDSKWRATRFLRAKKLKRNRSAQISWKIKRQYANSVSPSFTLKASLTATILQFALWVLGGAATIDVDDHTVAGVQCIAERWRNQLLMFLLR